VCAEYTKILRQIEETKKKKEEEEKNEKNQLHAILCISSLFN